MATPRRQDAGGVAEAHDREIRGWCSARLRVARNDHALVRPEHGNPRFTHGTAAQHSSSFRRGFDGGASTCDIR